MPNDNGADDIQAIADGLALWQEYAPQSAEDWMRVAERWLTTSGPNAPSATPEFRRLLGALVEFRSAAEAMERKCRAIESGEA